MSLYVQIVDNQMAQCIDTMPPAPIGTDGWKNAVEMRLAITAHRQGYTGHTFDLTSDPVQIVYETYDITVDERKSGMKSNANFAVQQLLQVGVENIDLEAIAAAKAEISVKQAAIDACTTHDELDALL